MSGSGGTSEVAPQKKQQIAAYINGIFNGGVGFLKKALLLSDTEQALTSLQRDAADSGQKAALPKLYKALYYLPQAALASAIGVQTAVLQNFMDYVDESFPQTIWKNGINLKKVIGDYQGVDQLPAYDKSFLPGARKSVLSTWKNRDTNSFTNYLEIYPQWASKIQQGIKSAQNKQEGMQSLAKQLNKQSSGYFNLQKLQGKASWNGSQWQGQAANKVAKFQKDTDLRYAKAYQRSVALQQVKVTSDQVKQQIPFVIRDIVDANSTLSKSGFGPLTPGGIALYGGRWVDPATGRLRVLPKASHDYINPLSKPQLLGYYQARLLNNWNELIGDIQRYNKLSQVSAQLFKERASRRIQAKLDPQVAATFKYKKYFSAITSFLSGSIPRQSAKYKLIGVIGATVKLLDLVPYSPEDVTQQQADDANLELDSVTNAALILIKDNIRVDTPLGLKQMNAYVSAAETLISSNITRQLGGYKQLARAAYMNNTKNPAQTSENIQTLSSIFNSIKRNRGNSISNMDQMTSTAREVMSVGVEPFEGIQKQIITPQFNNTPMTKISRTAVNPYRSQNTFGVPTRGTDGFYASDVALLSTAKKRAEQAAQLQKVEDMLRAQQLKLAKAKAEEAAKKKPAAKKSKPASRKLQQNTAQQGLSALVAQGEDLNKNTLVRTSAFIYNFEQLQRINALYRKFSTNSSFYEKQKNRNAIPPIDYMHAAQMYYSIVLSTKAQDKDKLSKVLGQKIDKVLTIQQLMLIPLKYIYALSKLDASDINKPQYAKRASRYAWLPYNIRQFIESRHETNGNKVSLRGSKETQYLNTRGLSRSQSLQNLLDKRQLDRYLL